MRHAEFQAMTARAAQIPEREPTDEELYRFFWIEPFEQQATARDVDRLVHRSNNVLTSDAYGVPSIASVDVTLTQAEAIAHRRYVAQLEVLERQLLQGLPTRVEPSQPVSRRVEPPTTERPRDWWKANAYWVQLSTDNGRTWYDVEGVGYSQTRAGAQALLDKMHRAQPHLRLRVAEPRA
jgi:hypothetical protein